LNNSELLLFISDGSSYSNNNVGYFEVDREEEEEKEEEEDEDDDEYGDDFNDNYMMQKVATADRLCTFMTKREPINQDCYDCHTCIELIVICTVCVNVGWYV